MGKVISTLQGCCCFGKNGFRESITEIEQVSQVSQVSQVREISSYSTPSYYGESEQLQSRYYSTDSECDSVDDNYDNINDELATSIKYYMMNNIHYVI
jgi:hypothetical protein